MSIKQHILMFILVFIGGLIGGVISNKITMDDMVFARKEVTLDYGLNMKHRKPEKVIEAEEFRLVDKNGNVLAKITRDVLDIPNISMSGITKDCLLTLNPYFITLCRNNRSLSITPQDITINSIKEGKGGLTKIINLITLSAFNNDPRISIGEEDGPHTVIGCTELFVEKTSSRIIRSPSSIVMFDKKGKVIWSAPE